MLFSDYNHHTKICYCAMLMGGRAVGEEACYDISIPIVTDYIGVHLAIILVATSEIALPSRVTE